MIKKATPLLCFAADRIVFDFDGTLCDSKGDIVATLRETLNRYGFTQQITDDIGIGPPLDIMIRQVVGEEVDQNMINRLVDDYRKIYNTSEFANSPLYPGARELLERLKKRDIPIAIATNKRETSTRHILIRKEIISYFDIVLSCDSNGRQWTKEQMLRNILDATGALGRTCLFFGDTVGDIQAALATGVTSVAALYGYGEPEELVKLQPDYVCERLTDLLD